MQKNLTMGEKIGDLLSTKGINAQKLSDDTGIPKATISEIISNKEKNFGYKTIVKVAEYLKVSVDYLVGLEPEPTNDKDVQFVCDYTGLSLKSISMFHNFAINSDDEFLNDIRINQINNFLESPTFSFLVDKLFNIGIASDSKIDTFADYKKFDDTTLNDEIFIVNDTLNFSKSLYFDLQYYFLEYYQQTSNVSITNFEIYYKKLLEEKNQRMNNNNFAPLTTRDLIYQTFTTKGESNADN